MNLQASGICPHCGARKQPGRAGVHLSGECRTSWYARERGKHPRKAGRPHRGDGDYTPEQIERIMARRALEQRYERWLLSQEGK